jgi:hypothetical protein
MNNGQWTMDELNIIHKKGYKKKKTSYSYTSAKSINLKMALLDKLR